MIIMIILFVLLGISVVCLILWPIFWGYVDDEGFIGLAVVTGILAFGTLIPGGVCIGINQPASIMSTEYKLAETINLYQYDKQILESYHLVADGDKTNFTSDITFEVVSTEKYYTMVRDYNKKVFDFKCDVKSHQYNRSNPWISWFVNEGYKSVSDEMLAQLEYTPGK